MTTLLISFSVFLVFFLLMAVGVILNNKTIKGSCGGLSNVGIERACNCKDACDEHQLYQISEPSNKQSH